MYAQRKLKDECFDNFFNHFTKTFQEKIVNYKGELDDIFEIYKGINQEFISVVNDWNRNQDAKAARDFWGVVGKSKKLLKQLQ